MAKVPVKKKASQKAKKASVPGQFTDAVDPRFAELEHTEIDENSPVAGLLVQFVCGGATLEKRQDCKCYVKDENCENGDCQGLLSPQSGVRTGVCWNPSALFLRSYNYLEMLDNIQRELKKENGETKDGGSVQVSDVRS
jgi:hypothetical protein